MVSMAGYPFSLHVVHSGAGSSEVWAVGGAAAALDASLTCWRVLYSTTLCQPELQHKFLRVCPLLWLKLHNQSL